jgi:hypothetical protein
MHPRDACEPCLDLFWEEADEHAVSEHPLHRELLHRLDIIACYDRLIGEAESGGREEELTTLLELQQRQLRHADALWDALQRHRSDAALAGRRPLVLR